MPDPTAPRSRFGGPILFAFALGGLLVGHALSYLIAVPDPHHRDLVLQWTGHGYLPTLIEIALVLLLGGIATLVGRALHRREREPDLRAVAMRLAAIQAVAFAGQELLERLVARVPVAGLLHDHVLAIGLLTQVVVAIVGAVLLRWLVRASNRVIELARTSAPLPRHGPALAVASPASVATASRPRRAFSVRGPPSPNASPA